MGPAAMLRKRRDLPFILISPHAPKLKHWSMPKLKKLIEEVLAKYPIDPDRFYLTGNSRGGFGAWALAAEMPDRFAAVAPICGGGDPRDVARIKDVPIWVFHGDRDTTIPIEQSIAMVEALRKVGGRVKFTVYPGVGHVSWPLAWNDEDLYTWFGQHRRGQPAPPPAAAAPAPE